MALSVVDLYSKILPKTNCKDCGFPTCLAFAGMVVSQKHPLKNCPHIPEDVLEKAQAELEEQYKQGKWLQKDMAGEALQYAKEKAASMTLKDISQRIGGKLTTIDGEESILLPYFNETVQIFKDRVSDDNGKNLSRNVQTFIYIHMAQGGSAPPSGVMKSFKEFPNTVSKIVSMTDHVETPLVKTFGSDKKALENACQDIGGIDVTDRYEACDLAFLFSAFPKVPVTLLFWEGQEGFEAQIKLMFDDTIVRHLDIESIMFLSEEIVAKLSPQAEDE